MTSLSKRVAETVTANGHPPVTKLSWPIGIAAEGRDIRQIATFLEEKK